MSITVDELIDKRRALERELTALLASRITEFTTETGVQVASVTVEQGIEVTTMSDERARRVLSGVRVELEI